MQTACPEALSLSKRNWMTPAILAKTAPTLISNFPDARVELILGLPGETPDSFRKGMLEFFKIGFRGFGIYSLMLSPGSEFYKKRKELGLEFHSVVSPIVTRTPHFSRVDIDRTRSFAYKFSVLAWLVQPEDLSFFQSQGIDLIDIADNMEELESSRKDKPGTGCCQGDPDCNAPPTYVSGACFDDVPPEMADKLADFIESRYKMSSEQAELIREYIRAKREIHTFERHANDSHKKRPEESKFPLLHAYKEIEAEPRIQRMLGLKPGRGARPTDSNTFFAVFNMNTMRAMPVAAKNTYLFRRILSELTNAMSMRELFNAFGAEQKNVVMKSIALLQKVGLIDIAFD